MVKKLILGLNGLLLLSAIGAFAAQNIINQLQPAASNFGNNSMNNKLTTAQQNASLNAWNEAFNKAKAFVINNSKNLAGVRDSDIITALNAIEKANTDIINVIKTSRDLTTGLQLKNQQTILANIQKYLVAATNNLSRANVILNNKKEAKAVLLSIGRFLEQAIQAFNTIIQTKITNVAPALPPRSTPNAPSRPQPAKPAAPQKVIRECPICYEDRELVKVPCKNNHPDMICKECLSQMKTCPFCRGPLAK